MSAKTYDQSTAETERLSIRPILFPPIFWPTPPWLPPIVLYERSETGGATGGGGQPNMLEILEAAYLRPDVRAAVVANTRAFTEMLSRDPEAARVFDELFGNAGKGKQDERAVPVLVWYGLCAAGGAVVGWLSRP